MPILKSSLTNWARLGATQRLIELKTEEASILKTFPELKKNGKTTKEAKPSSTRKPMAASARKAVAIRMKKFWAEKRKEQKK